MTITRRIAFVLLLAFGLSQTAIAQPAQTVHIAVDYGDGVMKTIMDIPWTEGLTVLDAMNAAAKRPHGITFEFRGTGSSALLTKIDDLANQGGGAGRKNWQFWVNAAYGTRSFGVYEVKPQDTVLWRFTEQGP